MNLLEVGCFGIYLIINILEQMMTFSLLLFTALISIILEYFLWITL